MLLSELKMRKEKRAIPKVITSVGIDVEQDEWLRKHRDFNLSEFLRECLEKRIKDERMFRREK